MMQESDLVHVQVIIQTIADFCIPAIKQKVCLKLNLNQHEYDLSSLRTSITVTITIYIL